MKQKKGKTLYLSPNTKNVTFQKNRKKVLKLCENQGAFEDCTQ